MKGAKKAKRAAGAMALHDRAEPFEAPLEECMVRTQIYLTRVEQEFLQAEAARKGVPMSAVIREIIDEKMRIPADAWASNPLLEPTPEAGDWQAPADGSVNHDHYVYGAPPAYREKKGEWEPVEQQET